MWLRKFIAFKIVKCPEFTLAELDTDFSRAAFKPCSGQEKLSFGFIPAFGQPEFVRPIEKSVWAQVKIETKRVPGALVKAELQKKIDEIKAAEGREISRKEKRELKERIADDLLIKAFPKQSVVTIVIDPVNGWVLMDVGSYAKADLPLQVLKDGMPELVLANLDFEQPVDATLATLLLDPDNAVDFLSADSSLTLKDPNTGAGARFSECNLHQPEVIAHLKSGMRITAIDLTFDDSLSFSLSNQATVSKLKIDAGDTPMEKDDLDGTLALQLGALRQLVGDLTQWLGLKDLTASAEATAA